MRERVCVRERECVCERERECVCVSECLSHARVNVQIHMHMHMYILHTYTHILHTYFPTHIITAQWSDGRKTDARHVGKASHCVSLSPPPSTRVT